MLSNGTRRPSSHSFLLEEPSFLNSFFPLEKKLFFFLPGGEESVCAGGSGGEELVTCLGAGTWAWAGAGCGGGDGSTSAAGSRTVRWERARPCRPARGWAAPSGPVAPGSSCSTEVVALTWRRANTVDENMTLHNHALYMCLHVRSVSMLGDRGHMRTTGA